MTEPSLQTLGRYTVHAELGKGGFATVYRATDTTLERDVALKILKPGWTDDAKAVERFMREAKQASRLKHANIVTIYDVGQAEGRLFIAMELVRGRSLQQIVTEDGAIAWPRMLAILEQSAAALDYAHDEGLVHRDVKPANIILDESKPGSTVHAVLTDFGLVRGAEQASLSMGSTGGLLGTPEYLAPEIWDGEPATKASDIYALGCVAYFLLTGKILFGATTPVAVLKRHVAGPVFPEQWPNGVPAEAEAVLRRALAKDPNQRQASAAEFLAELRACEGQTAREQEAKQKEETEHAAQIALAAETARRAEEERAAKEETDRKAREELERQRQAELAAQAAAGKAKQEAAEQERQRQAREAARLAEEEARRKELDTSEKLARQQLAAAPPAPRPQAAVPPRETIVSASKTKLNRTWVYVAGGGIALVVVAILLASTRPFAPIATPAPAPTAAPAAPATAAPAVQSTALYAWIQSSLVPVPTSVSGLIQSVMMDGYFVCPPVIFHAVTAIESAPADTTFTVRWYAVDIGAAAAPNTLISSADVITMGTRTIDLDLEPQTKWPGVKRWPVGNYRLEILVNGVLDRVIEFEVHSSNICA